MLRRFYADFPEHVLWRNQSEAHVIDASYAFACLSENGGAQRYLGEGEFAKVAYDTAHAAAPRVHANPALPTARLRSRARSGAAFTNHGARGRKARSSRMRLHLDVAPPHVSTRAAPAGVRERA